MFARPLEAPIYHPVLKHSRFAGAHGSRFRLSPIHIIPCSNILAALRNCARDDIGGRPGDYVDAVCLARVPSGQGWASSLIGALLGGLLLCGSFFVFGYICFC